MAVAEGYGKIITNGLVLALDAADRNSYPGTGTTWTDLSGTGNNGTLTNGPTFNFGNGGSIVFDGTDDYMLGQQIGMFPTGVQALTIEVWVYNQDTGTKGIFSYGKSLAGQRIELGTRPSNFIVFAIDGGAYGFSEATNINNWMCLTVIPGILNSQTKIYKNGVQKSLVLQAGADLSRNTASVGTYYVGAIVNSTGDGVNAGSFLTGRISIVRMYNRELTATEIQQNYNATKTRFGL